MYVEIIPSKDENLTFFLYSRMVKNTVVTTISDENEKQINSFILILRDKHTILICLVLQKFDQKELDHRLEYKDYTNAFLE